MNKTKTMLLACSAIAALDWVSAAQAQTRTFNVPAEDAVKAIPEFARQAGIQIVAPGDHLRGVRTPAITGSLELHAALSQLLSGTGIEIASDDGQTIILRVPPKNAEAASSDGAASNTNVETVTVTGTHIRGVQPSTPLITLSQEDIRTSGQTDLGQALRSLPQNYAGGQNPGVNIGSLNGNGNVTSASAPNIYGLGPDATLTLLNGRRLSYGSFTQSTDISDIPLAAIDQVQVLLDGASAVYGSDAVAGVVNVVLKKDFQGLTATARLATTADGGLDQQQYSLVGGQTWSSGGFIVTANYERDGAVDASQRSFTDALQMPYTIYPSLKTFGGVFSGHQDVTDSIHASLDVLYNQRNSFQIQTIAPFYEQQNNGRDTALSASGTITFDLPNAWEASVNGVYSQDHEASLGQLFPIGGGAVIEADYRCNCNSNASAEFDADGPLLDLPAGKIQSAWGFGYRTVGFNVNGSVTNNRSDKYAFGELNIPVISDENAIPAVRRLTVNAAARYEDYSGSGSVVTPKVGITWSTSPDLDISGTWGRAFKEPTLEQLYEPTELDLLPSDIIDGGVPGSNFLLVSGGNRSLKPEKATTETASIVFHPESIAGLRLSATYFNIRYTDRVIPAISNINLALTNPAYAPFVMRNPTLAQVNAAFDAYPNFFNDTDSPVDPTNISLIASELYENAESQHYDGVNLEAAYAFDVFSGTMTASANTSWLEGTQREFAAGARQSIVGSVYFPTHWKARGGLVWTKGDLTLASYLNYIGSEESNLTGPILQVGSQTTMDVAITYSPRLDSGILADTQIILSAANLFDTSPPNLRQTQQYFVNYDSTNYSAIGTLISLSISKHF